MVLMINNEEVKQLLAMGDYMQALEEIALEYASGEATCVPRIDVHLDLGRDGEAYCLGTMQGASKRHRAYALRLKSDVHYWVRENGYQTEEKYASRPGLFCGLVLLFSAENGEPQAIINEGYLQHMRVGARLGLTVKYLARREATTIGMIGSGGMARTLAEAAREVRPLRKIKVYSRTREHREAYAREMSEKLALEVEPVDSARRAIQGTDIVGLCTDSIIKVVEREWFEPGMHVVEVNAAQLDFEPGEVFDVIFTFAPAPVPLGHGGPLAPGNLDFAGSTTQVRQVPESKRRWGRTRRVGQRARVVTLPELVTGKARGRLNEQELTFHGHAGDGGTQGLHFVAVAPLIYQRARERGLGREIPTEWFLQDIRD